MAHHFDTPPQSKGHGVARNSYFESTPELDSSNTSSPHHTNEMFPFASDTSTEMYNHQQDWSQVDFTQFGAFDEHDQISKPSERANSTDSEKVEAGVSNTKLRRRAQNRASQRAFRERKEKHVKGLEYQLESLNEKHQDLLQSYTRQADIVVRLTGRIAELQTELKAIKAAGPGPFDFHGQAVPTPSHYVGPAPGLMLWTDNFDKFDAFNFSPMHDSRRDPVVYSGSDVMSFDSANITPAASLSPATTASSLPGFEDLLRP